MFLKMKDGYIIILVIDGWDECDDELGEVHWLS